MGHCGQSDLDLQPIVTQPHPTLDALCLRLDNNFTKQWCKSVFLCLCKSNFFKISFCFYFDVHSDVLCKMCENVRSDFAFFFFLKGSLGDTLKEVQPTAFLGVPRVWEKIQEKMIAVGRSQGTIKRRIALWAKDVGLRGTYAYMNGYVRSACSIRCSVRSIWCDRA